MEWGGKLVGGAVGLLVAGPVGAALGVLAGHLVDDKIETTRSSSRKAPPRPAKASGASKPRVTTRQAEHGTRPSTLHHIEDTDPFANAAFDAESEESPAVEDPEAVASQFFQITFEVMGHVAKCDGRVSESDIRAARAVMKDFELTDTQIAQAIGHFNAGKASHYDVERSVMGLRRVCAGRPDLLRTFLEIQVRVAIIGSDLQGPARPLLTRVATILGVGGLEFAQLETLLRIRYRARGNRGDAADWNRPADGVHEPPAAEAGGAGERGARSGSRGRAGDRSPPSPMRMTLQEAYQVLAVMPGEPMQVITRAYRRQLSRHHPDKLKANGLPESMLGFAQQQTQLVIEAYNIIRESRGEPT
jgi:DnaJ like chaperone protein